MLAEFCLSEDLDVGGDLMEGGLRHNRLLRAVLIFEGLQPCGCRPIMQIRQNEQYNKYVDNFISLLQFLQSL